MVREPRMLPAKSSMMTVAPRAGAAMPRAASIAASSANRTPRESTRNSLMVIDGLLTRSAARALTGGCAPEPITLASVMENTRPQHCAKNVLP